MACSFFFFVIAYLYFPYVYFSGPAPSVSNADIKPNRETRRKTLEEIAAAFGDKVVTLTEREMAIEEAIAEDKIVAEHVERVDDGKKV